MSHKEEYKLGQSNHRKQMGPPGPGMGGGGEKAKYFKTTWVKLLQYCKKYWLVMVIALLCAVMGTVLTLIGPDKLSELTDLITKGIC